MTLRESWCLNAPSLILVPRFYCEIDISCSHFWKAKIPKYEGFPWTTLGEGIEIILRIHSHCVVVCVCFKAEIKFLKFLQKNSNGGHKIISCVHEADTYSPNPKETATFVSKTPFSYESFRIFFHFIFKMISKILAKRVYLDVSS